MGYVVIALLNEGTRGKFKKIYHSDFLELFETAIEDESLELSLRREMVQMAIDRLSWFDRQVINLYLEGWKMVEISKETGIEVSTLYQSLHRSKKFIAHVIGLRK